MSDQILPTHPTTANISPLKIANLPALPANESSRGDRTLLSSLVCLSQCSLTCERSFSFLFLTCDALRVPVPPSTKLTPHPHPHRWQGPPSRQLKLCRSEQQPASCWGSVQNCRSPKPNAIALLLSTHPLHRGWRTGGGRRTAKKMWALYIWDSRYHDLTVSSVLKSPVSPGERT